MRMPFRTSRKADAGAEISHETPFEWGGRVDVGCWQQVLRAKIARLGNGAIHGD